MAIIFHVDQHGTAVVVMGGLTNALKGMGHQSTHPLLVGRSTAKQKYTN